MGLTLMINSGVPKHLWVEAFTTAVYLINRFPFFVINMKSPFSSLYGHETFQGEITTFSDTSDWFTLNQSSEHSSDSTVQGAIIHVPKAFYLSLQPQASTLWP